MKVKEKIIIVYLFLFLATANLCSCMSSETRAKREKAVNKAKVVGVCLKAMAEAMPPEFCKREGGLDGFDKVCPKGTKERSWYQSGCLKKCKKGYKTDGDDCKKKGKRTYSRVVDKVCPEGTYKKGILGGCYQDCGIIGMYNCMSLYCSISKGHCTAALIDMILDVFMGLTDLYLFCLSSGISSLVKGATQSIKNGLKKLGQSAVRKISKFAVKAFMGKFKKLLRKRAIAIAQKTVRSLAIGTLGAIMKKAVKKASKKSVKNGLGDVAKDSTLKIMKDKLKDQVKDAAVSGFTNAGISAVCSEVYNKLNPKPSRKGATIKAVVSALDIFNTQGITASCLNKNTKHPEDCEKQVMVGLSVFDPTGLLTIAAAFKHRSCNIPKKLPKLKTDNKIIKPINVKEGCVRMFKHKDFEGKSKTYCKNTTYVGKKDNDHWSSFILGDDTSVVFFQHSKYKGKSYYTEKKAMSDLNKIGYNDMISSIQISKKENRVVMFRHYNYNGTAWMYTKGQSTKHVGKDQNDQISSIKVGKKVKVKVYEHSKYKGKKKTFTKSTKNVGSTWNDKITSLKVSSK